MKIPDNLGSVGKKKFNQFVKLLEDNKSLHELDADSIALYCYTYEIYLEAVNGLKTEGMLSETSNGYRQVSPYFTIINNSVKTLQALLKEFGLTPVSRKKLMKEPEPEAEDEIDKLLSYEQH